MLWLCFEARRCQCCGYVLKHTGVRVVAMFVLKHTGVSVVAMFF